MQVIPKWEVTVVFKGGKGAEFTFYVHDTHLSNVLRKVADLSFPEEPLGYRIGYVKYEEPTVSTHYVRTEPPNQ